MDLTKSKKRKISDFFGPMPTKVTRYQRDQKVGAKATEKPVSAEPQIPLRKNVSPVEQGTQTDGFNEINSMKKEGLKFLVSRISSYEAKRATESFKPCSIADEHFFLKTEGTEEWESENEKKRYFIRILGYQEDFEAIIDADCNELGYLNYKSIEHLDTIQQEDQKYREPWEEHISHYDLKSEKLPTPITNSALVDKMTQYGDDNLDDDF